MARDVRFDFRKGLNLAFSEDALDSKEVRRARNLRHGRYGALQTRDGNQRVHVTALEAGAAVLGLRQWFPSSGRELVAVAGGKLFHKLQAAANFTEGGTGLSTTVRPDFETHIIAGVPTLFIADGTLRKWNGTTLSAVAGAPAGLRSIKVYKTRMFASDGTKTLYWSRVSNPETWTAPLGGQAFIETYDAEGIQALEVVGSSLLIFKTNSVARFTGVSSENIRIDQETEGVSADVGTIAPRTVLRIEQRVFFLTDRGPHWATESGAVPAGVAIEPAFDEAERDHLANAVAVHHKVRKEVWIFFPENTETTNTVGYCFNYRTESWTGPWEFSAQFDVASAAEFELNDNSESVVLGGYDGRVRQDEPAVGARDDVLADGTGGTAITFDMELPVLMMGDPSLVKQFTGYQEAALDLGASGSVTVNFTSDLVPNVRSTIINSGGPGVRQYRFRVPGSFKRGDLSFTGTGAGVVAFNGLTLRSGSFRRIV